jgi:hypothetical protein
MDVVSSCARAVVLLAVLPAAGAGAPRAWFADLLEQMHPEYRAFVHEVRGGATRLHPQGLVAGLVRPGGRDPRDPRDAPLAGAGTRNDIIVYEDTFEPGASEAWRRVLVDHEYFHALHLGHGAAAPAVDFGDPGVNRDYYEALAWGYNLERIEQSSYPGLSLGERRLAEERYRGHRLAFERWLQRDHRDAWQHYGRFFTSRSAASDR